MNRELLMLVEAISREKNVERDVVFGAVESALAGVRNAATGGQNLMPHLLEAARVHATEGEIIESLQQVFGSYTETPVF